MEYLSYISWSMIYNLKSHSFTCKKKPHGRLYGYLYQIDEQWITDSQPSTEAHMEDSDGLFQKK